MSGSIEVKAVTKLKDKLVNKGKLIVPLFSENDKTPLFYGSILVYENKRQRNSDLYKSGKIDVQIKGLENKDYAI